MSCTTQTEMAHTPLFRRHSIWKYQFRELGVNRASLDGSLTLVHMAVQFCARVCVCTLSLEANEAVKLVGS